DASAQIELGREEFEELTGIHPRGMWPPERAVGESVARLTTQCGVDWIVGDEDVLARSIGKHLGRDGEGRLHEPELLYRPWRIERDGRSVAMVFRDNPLSNAIGFDYHRMHARDAVGDFTGRLRRIPDQQAEDRDLLVVVALDWDNQFRLHLRNVYRLLEAKPPTALFRPIMQRGPSEDLRPPAAVFTPTGPDDPGWEEKAGRYDVGGGFGAMHKPIDLVSGIRYA